jgi:PhoH-like ATPase
MTRTLGGRVGHQKRKYILDTNVFLYDPRALDVFEEHEIVIPMTVIEEIDRFKKDVNETGRNARSTSRRLDALRDQGSLRDGVALPGGGSLRVDYADGDADLLRITWGVDSNDNRILQTAVRLTQQHGEAVVLVTRDTNMRLKADALGVLAEDYENAHLDVDEAWTGVVERYVPLDVVQAVAAGSDVGLDDTGPIPPNAFVVLKSLGDEVRPAMARVRPDGLTLRPVAAHREGSWGVTARNKEQWFAMDLLLDPEVQLVTLHGMAGTGKTLMAMACGLKQVADQQRYRKLLVSRPVFPLGRDIGFLPGDLNEKLNPWMKPIFDNLEFLLSSRPKTRRTHEPEYQYLLDSKIIEVEALTYIRGRSIPQQFLIIDEAQNLTPHEVKTVLTRAGEGTKIVLTGDPQQIDNPYVDELSNGLTYVVERFKSDGIAGHVTLRKGERSPLAELAARLL